MVVRRGIEDRKSLAYVITSGKEVGPRRRYKLKSYFISHKKCVSSSNAIPVLLSSINRPRWLEVVMISCDFGRQKYKSVGR